MITRIRKIYGAATSDTNDVAHIDIQRDGLITGIVMDIQLVGTTTACRGHWEISFTSVQQLTTNDAMGPIFSGCNLYNFSTNGGANLSKTESQTGLAVPVKQGDRLYLHTDVNGTITLNQCNVYLYIAER